MIKLDFPAIHLEPKYTRVIFGVGLIVTGSGLISPPLALVLGIVFGLSFPHPFPVGSRKAARFLLQASVVGLGFGMNLHEVIRIGSSGFVYTFLGIGFALLAGRLLGKVLKVRDVPSFLISIGTAICGCSAIAAVGPITEASEDEMAVSLGTVFLLNSVALLLFPTIGLLLGLTQIKFGLWAALAIHDTSSVVGAAAKYGSEALAIATTVKLARALWIVPIAVATALMTRRRTRITWPWFILFFCVAAVFNTYLPAGIFVYGWLTVWAKIGLVVTLYLIGAGISRATLKQVGPQPLIQGTLLWLLVAVGSLWSIRLGWISL